MPETSKSAALGLPLIVTTYGGFRVTWACGADATPKSAKAQGLLALLVVSDDMRRSRAWLQDKLWSDRAPEQGAASLRQVLSELRRVFDPMRDVMQTDRLKVCLDPACFQIKDPSWERTGEFLEGLDIRDPEFNIWLSSERARRAPAPSSITTALATPHAPDRAPSVRFLSRRGEDPTTDWMTASITDQAAELVRDIHAAEVTIVSAPESLEDPRIDFQCEIETVLAPPGDLGVRINLTTAQGARLVWQGGRRFAQCGLSILDDPALKRLLQNLSDALGQSILNTRSRRPLNGGSLTSMESILRKIFSMEKMPILEADKALAAAFERDPHPSFLAWRSQLRTIQWAEKYESDVQTLSAEARDFSRRALELDQFNAVALSASANAYLLLDRNSELGRSQANRALDSNASNPFAWWSASNAALYQGDLKTARTAVETGAKIAAISRRTFWWDVQAGAVALMMGDLEAARRAFLSSHQKRKAFRPPLRYLIALEAALGNLEAAAKFAEKLKRLETGFSVQRLCEEVEYPASLLRKAPNLSLAPLAELRGV